MTLALARTALQAGNIPLAITTYKDALQLTDSSDTWIELGEAYSRIGNTQQARNAWQQAITRQPGNIRAYHNLYIAYLNAADPHAPDVLTQLLTINTAERTRIGQQWHSALSEHNLAASAEEIDTLLNLSPQVINPANYPLPRASQN
jgi:Flp pilus assembly protein TadD